MTNATLANNTELTLEDKNFNESQKPIEAHNFWYICLMFLHNPNFLLAPAYYLQELYPLNCNSISFPETFTNLQLFLLALNTNPNACNALQNFTLEGKYIHLFCSPGDQYLDLGIFGRKEYVNTETLKEAFRLQPFQGGVNVLQILLKNPSVYALFDIIMAKFPEDRSTPREGLGFLLELVSDEDSELFSSKPYILISSANIRRLLKQENEVLNTAQKLQLFSDKLYRYLKVFEPELLKSCSCPIVAEVIKNTFKINIASETIQKYLSNANIFQPGEKFTLSKDNNTKTELLKIVMGLDFNIFY